MSSNGLGGKRKRDMEGGPVPVDQWCDTEVEIDTFSFHWSIKNYSSINSDSILSTKFKGGPKSGNEWQLKLFPKYKSSGTEHLAVYLIPTGFGGGGGWFSSPTVARNVTARFLITLVDPEGRPLIPGFSSPFREIEEDIGWGFANFLKSTEVTELIKHDTLTIHCRVWTEGDPRHRVGQVREGIRNNPDEIKRRGYEGLSSNFQELLGDPKFADLALSTPTKTFMVHKAILSTRSSVFRAMLNADMVESATNTIDIPDFDEDVVKAMLDYIYTGKTPDLTEKAVDLMQISDKYDLGGLKKECELAIASDLTVENAVDVLVLAHLHNAVTLKGQVMDFTSRNKDGVKETQSFKNLAPPNPNSTLLMDLYLSQ